MIKSNLLFHTATNIALNKPALQVGDYHNGGDPSLAVDGDTNGIFEEKSCTHTDQDEHDDVNNNWWAVDLEDTYQIQRVTLYNREDCCGECLFPN